MGFFGGLLFGVAFGIGFMVSLARYQILQTAHCIDLMATIAVFSSMTVADSSKLLPGEYYPPWVVFGKRQKLNWLNHIMNKIWPYVDEAASDLIRSSVEPILEQYKPMVLSSMKFSKLTLGTMAPQFTGHSWISVDGVEPDKPFDPAVLTRLTQFSAMNKLKNGSKGMNYELILESWIVMSGVVEYQWEVHLTFLCILEMLAVESIGANKAKNCC